MIEEIRVGICDCNPYYHGRIFGRKIYFPKAGIECETIFKLAECPIPFSYEREALLTLRCHFFLDLHVAGNVLHTDVRRVDLVFNSKRVNWNVYLGGFYCGRLAKNFRSGVRKWSGETPPNVDEVITGISQLLGSMSTPKFERWLDIMTPQNWQVIRR